MQDVYGDGIILFRDSDGLIETSTAWQTGMQPTETTGTPNAIWTWTCTDCVVRDNEAYLTDSPGVDGGAYDIDWDNTRNTIDAVGNNIYLATTASGQPVIGTPGGSEGLGTLQQGMLEQSNVSVVNQFVAMILAQRSYESNSRVVKAADEMLQQLNQLAQ